MADRHVAVSGAMPRLLAWLVLTLLIGWAGWSSLGAQDAVLRLGVLDDERGALANGARLAVDEINRAGGVLGADGTFYRLELVVQGPDANGSLAEALGNLGQASLTAVLGPVTTEQTLDNLAGLVGLGIPVITPAVGDTILASDSSGRVFRGRAAEVLQGRALATYLVEDLELRTVTTVQLDVNSIAALVGFSTAASAFGMNTQTPILYQPGGDLNEIITRALNQRSDVVVIYGPPELALQVTLGLLVEGYTGRIAYHQAQNPAFANGLPLGILAEIITTDTWSAANFDEISTRFVLNYTRAYSSAPNSIAVAGYDSVRLIARALGLPGRLEDNLASLTDVQGVQGVLSPAELTRGETSEHVVVLEFTPFGGVEVMARFAGSDRITGEDQIVAAEPTPAPTATPEGTVITVISNVLNVRTGPGTNYDIIGQLRQGDQRQVIGANQNFTWAVIEFRGQEGWVSTASNLVEVFGNLNEVLLVAAPPTPTPAPPTATPIPDRPDLVIVNVSPSQVLFNTPTVVEVTVQNIGGRAAGPFAVATSFAPNNVYAAQNLGGLAAGGITTFQLTMPPIAQTGNFEAVVIADLNNEVDEGPIGEANNNFIYRYKVDRPSILNVTTLSLGAAIDLDGDGLLDVNFNAAGLGANGTCNGSSYCVGLLSPALNWDTAHYDAVSSLNGINAGTILNASIQPGTTIGVLTASGNRVVLRVDAFTPGLSITFVYRRYV